MHNYNYRSSENWIFVKTLTGKTITIEYNEGMTLSQFINVIAQKEGIPAKQIRIIYAGKLLTGNSKEELKEAVTENMTLHLVLRLSSQTVPTENVQIKNGKLIWIIKHAFLGENYDINEKHFSILYADNLDQALEAYKKRNDKNQMNEKGKAKKEKTYLILAEVESDFEQQFWKEYSNLKRQNIVQEYDTIANINDFFTKNVGGCYESSKIEVKNLTSITEKLIEDQVKIRPLVYLQENDAKGRYKFPYIYKLQQPTSPSGQDIYQQKLNNLYKMISEAKSGDSLVEFFGGFSGKKFTIDTILPDGCINDIDIFLDPIFESLIEELDVVQIEKWLSKLNKRLDEQSDENQSDIDIDVDVNNLKVTQLKEDYEKYYMLSNGVVRLHLGTKYGLKENDPEILKKIWQDAIKKYTTQYFLPNNLLLTLKKVLENTFVLPKTEEEKRFREESLAKISKITIANANNEVTSLVALGLDLSFSKIYIEKLVEFFDSLKTHTDEYKDKEETEVEEKAPKTVRENKENKEAKGILWENLPGNIKSFISESTKRERSVNANIPKDKGAYWNGLGCADQKALLKNKLLDAPYKYALNNEQKENYFTSITSSCLPEHFKTFLKSKNFNTSNSSASNTLFCSLPEDFKVILERNNCGYPNIEAYWKNIVQKKKNELINEYNKGNKGRRQWQGASEREKQELINEYVDSLFKLQVQNNPAIISNLPNNNNPSV